MSGWRRGIVTEQLTLPTQYYPGRALTPYQKLAMALIEGAINDAYRLQAVGSQAARLKEHGRLWLEEGCVGPISFEEACCLLNLEPDYIMEQLARGAHWRFNVRQVFSARSQVAKPGKMLYRKSRSS